MAAPRAGDSSSWLDPSTPWRSEDLSFRFPETDCGLVRIQTNGEELRRAQIGHELRERKRSGKRRRQASRPDRGDEAHFVRSKMKRARMRAGQERQGYFS